MSLLFLSVEDNSEIAFIMQGRDHREDKGVRLSFSGTKSNCHGREENTMKRKLWGFVLVVALVTATGNVCAQDMGMVTGSTKGTYYQFGLNLADLLKPRGIKLRVDESAGSIQNVYAVYKTPNTQLGIVQSDVLAFVAKIGTDPVMKKIAEKTKLVFPLYNEEVHLLVRGNIKDFDGLEDRVVAIGAEGSGVYLTARLLFETSGVEPSEMLPVGPLEALALLKQGKIDAMFYVAGLPVKLFAEDVTAADRLSLVPITNRNILEFYPAVQIPAKTYAWQDKAIDTVAVKAVLISYDFRGGNCGNVGRAARILYDNLEWLRENGHPKWKVVDLSAPLKGWQQYDCVAKALPQAKRRAPEKPAVVNPVMDAIKKMFSE
jgi:TRAP transporter TAXI family solute receptor